MPYADVENGPSERDIPWYAHFNTWGELYESEYEDPNDPHAMESIRMARHEVFEQGGGPDEYQKMLVDELVMALTEYDGGAALPIIHEDLYRSTAWTKVDRDDQIWEAVMTLAYFVWQRKHTDLFDPVYKEIETLGAFKALGRQRIEQYKGSKDPVE